MLCRILHVFRYFECLRQMLHLCRLVQNFYNLVLDSPPLRHNFNKGLLGPGFHCKKWLEIVANEFLDGFRMLKCLEHHPPLTWLGRPRAPDANIFYLRFNLFLLLK